MQSNQERILALDYGTVRIGVAVSDPLALFAIPLDYVKNDSRKWEFFGSLLSLYHCTHIILGLPLNLKGLESQKAEEIRTFANELHEKFKVQVELVDERFTTVIAHRTILSTTPKKSAREKRKEFVDSRAAAILLEGYLNARAKRKSC